VSKRKADTIAGETTPLKQQRQDEVKQIAVDVKIKIEPCQDLPTRLGCASDNDVQDVVKEGFAEQKIKTEKHELLPSDLQPLTEADGGLWFFFVDAIEDERSNPPMINLFGKVRTQSGTTAKISYHSCCLVVENLERCVYLLLNVHDPDDEQSVANIAEEAAIEFKQMCAQKCPKVRCLRSKLVRRNYAFEKVIGRDHGCLPVLKFYLQGDKLPIGLTGQNFGTVFGGQSSFLERLMLTKRMMGPSWIRLQPGSFAESVAKVSFCPFELRIQAASITVPKTSTDLQKLSEMGMPTTSPPLRVLSLSMQTLQRSAEHSHEPIVMGMTFHPNFNIEAADSDKEFRSGMSKWMAIRRFDSQPFPRDADKLLAQREVQQFPSEAAMLSAFLAKIGDFDPDVIVGHTVYGFDLEVLSSRLHAQKSLQWQKFGRLRKAKQNMPRLDGSKGGFWAGSNLASGRLICDVHMQAKELLPKLSSYELSDLSQEVLNVACTGSLEPNDLMQHFNNATTLVRLAENTLQNALSLAQIAHHLQILPLSKQLTNLAGNLWNSSLQNKRAERNELLLCHEFHRRKYILPDKETTTSRARRKAVAQGISGAAALDNAEDAETVVAGPRRGKAAYSGGLVLEPKVGLYDDFVMMLDFNSLYPSVIQEHNICFTTVERPDEDQVANITCEVELLSRTQLPDGTVSEGVLPQVIRRLVDSRKEVKNAMKSAQDPRRFQNLNIRQQALKLIANSIYGCLGFQHSRFHARPLAALVTCKGREALNSTCTVITQELQLDVVYGDTDSVFVNSKTKDFEHAMQVAQLIKRSVNKRYKRLEIEVDAIFSRLLLLKKKKYAGLKVNDWANRKFEKELKGLDIVRRDWCPVAKDLGERILTQILCGENSDEPAHWISTVLAEKGQQMDESKVPLEKYIITKSITKPPQDYPDAKHLPHVQVALRLMARGKAVTSGQDIPYVISLADVETEAKSSFASRARHPHDFQLDPSLKVDVAWYKSQQVHPLVTRLVGPIDGIDAARIAECLGMDSARFSKVGNGNVSVNRFVELTSGNVEALLDRNKRWVDFGSCLEGVQCLVTSELTPWQYLLQPAVQNSSEVDHLFRTQSGHAVNTRQACNCFVLQIKKLLLEYSEGWVKLGDGERHEAGVLKTRRLRRCQNVVSEHVVLQELEHMEYLCACAIRSSGTDTRGCRTAVAGIQRVCTFLLQCNGYYWVDCNKVFASILGCK